MKNGIIKENEDTNKKSCQNTHRFEETVCRFGYERFRDIQKWTMPMRDWGLAYAQFSIYFEDRFAA